MKINEKYTKPITHVDRFMYEKHQMNILKQASENMVINGNKNLFDLGRDCFFNPELMEGMSEDTLNNKSFLNGYNHGKRLALIDEMEKKQGKSK